MWSQHQPVNLHQNSFCPIFLLSLPRLFKTGVIARSLSSKELLDEGNHLWLLDCSRVVLVEGTENLVEGFLGEFVTGSEVSEGVLNEFLCLFLIEGTGLVNIISVPNLVDDALDSLFFWSGHFALDKFA